MGVEWYGSLPDDLTFDNNGAPTPVREHPFVKESPDLGHFVNKALAAHREAGSRIPVKKFEKPEEREAWRKEHLPKLYAAGVLEAPPAKPEEYGIKKPDDFSSDLLWSDERANKFAAALHKWGIPKGAAPELLALHNEALLAGQEILKTDYESCMAALREEFKDKFDERFEAAGRLMKTVVSEEEMELLNRTGLANHPRLMGMFMRLAPLASQDSSAGMNTSDTSSAASAEQVRSEVADIMSNPNNPKHKGYWANDPAVMQYIDGLYKKAYGSGSVTLG